MQLLDSAGLTEDASGGVEAVRSPTDHQREPDDADNIPGLGRVLESVPASWHPVSVTRFLHTPQPDIAIDNAPATPIEWLKHSGGDIAPILNLIEIAEWTAR